MTFKSHCAKKAVIDTSVILYEALALKNFPNTDIYIPLALMEEIDRFKRDMGENGRNARQFSRFMDSLRRQASLTKGAPLDNGSYIYACMPSLREEEWPRPLDRKSADHQILGLALQLKKRFPKDSVELISKDINLRVKADVFGVQSKDYDPHHLGGLDEMYSGIRRIKMKSARIDRFFKEGALDLEGEKLFANQYTLMEAGEKKAFGRYDKQKNQILPLSSNGEPVWRVHPRNPEQNFAFDALLNEKILFVSLVGKAGTGKTLLALAAGLYKTMDQGVYKRLLVSRPVFPMGRDIGYLPGDIEQKLNPWMQPIFDSLEFIMGMGKSAGRLTQDLMDQGLLSIEPLAYIRGRSIPQQYLIVDEAQNLSPP